MAWIESHQNLLHHPKTLDLMNLMEWDVDTTLGKLHRFWWWCMEYAPDGDLRRHNHPRLGAAVGIPRDQLDRFINAMIQAEFLDSAPYFRVHDWWDYAGPFLQTKHKRHPEIWQRVREMYQPGYGVGGARNCGITPANPEQATLEQAHDEQTRQSGTGSNGTISRGNFQQSDQTYPHTTAISGIRDDIPAPQTDQVYRYSTGTNEQVQPYCAVPPNQPNLTIPNQTNQQHQQQQRATLQTEREPEHPDRHQQQPSPTRPSVAGAAADDAGPGHCTYAPPTRAVPENDLKQIIYDRVGHKVQLSRLDMAKIADLRNRHGTRFFGVCDALHGGVTNPAAYLHSILEPEDSTDKLVQRMKELLPMQATKSN